MQVGEAEGIGEPPEHHEMLRGKRGHQRDPEPSGPKGSKEEYLLGSLMGSGANWEAQ